MADTTRMSTSMQARPAHAADLPLLERPEELALEGQRELADLVQEQGAAVGHLDQPRLRLDSAREGTLLVAEQLGLQELLGQRGAVDGHERLGGALAVGVDGPRDELLARPGLAQDEDVGLRPRRLLDQLEDAHHGRAAPDDVLEAERLLELLAQVAILALERALPQRAVDGDAELLGP